MANQHTQITTPEMLATALKFVLHDNGMRMWMMMRGDYGGAVVKMDEASERRVMEAVLRVQEEIEAAKFERIVRDPKPEDLAQAAKLDEQFQQFIATATGAQ